MYTIELIKQILRDINRHKVRSILAMFGIIWGTIAVVMLLALGEGFYTAQRANMMGISEGAVMFMPGTTSLPFRGFPIGSKIHLTASNVLDIKRAVPGIEYLSPVLMNNQTISYGEHVVKANITGSNPDYSIIRKRYPAVGSRFIDPLDVKTARNVIFLGKQVYEKLFSKADPVGKTVLVNSVPFTVVGIQKEMTSSGTWYNNIAVIPYTTAIKLWGDKPVQQFLAMAANVNNTTTMENNIKQYLANRYHYDVKDKDALHSFNPTEILQFVIWFFRGIELFLGFCGALTLAVGGIGVANIMYLIVLERTQEIGLRMALGAEEKHIMLQILLEALLIIGIAGLIGFLVSGVAIFILQQVHLPTWIGQPKFSLSVLIGTISVLALVTIFAGFFPARRAAKMTPVEALSF